MKHRTSFVLLVTLVPLWASCTSPSRKQPDRALSAAVHSDKPVKDSVKAEESDLDEYDAVAIADPLERLNRGTFWVNDWVYTIVLRPVSKGYEIVVPRPMRQGLTNIFENVKFPIRFVNDTLQGKFDRALKETGKFFVNSTVGVGGILRLSDRFPALADVPAADTGQTFAKWGIGHGAYLVLPLLGPSSLRDTVGLAGDYALNPVSWVTIVWGGDIWTIAIPSTNTLRALPNELSKYDSATQNAIDRYIAARSAYVQYRREAALK